MTEDATYEIVWDSKARTTFVYRSLRAGVCGPWTTPTAATDREQAEAEALRYSVLRTGPWSTTSNGYEFAPAQRITSDL